jgi:hypothetical protein
MISKDEGAILENSCATMRPLSPPKTLLEDKPTMKFIDLSAAENVIESSRKENSGTKCSKLSSIVAESTEIFEHQYDKMLKTGVPAAGLKHKTNNVVGSVISDAFLVAGDETDKSCLYLLPKTNFWEEKEEFPSNKPNILNKIFSKAELNNEKANDGRDSKIAECLLAINKPSNSFSTEPLVEERVDSIISEALLAIRKKTGSSFEAALSKEEEEQIVRYGEMLKMGIHIDEVKHRMTIEGVDTRIVDAVLLVAPKTNSYSVDPLNDSLSKEEEDLVVKYRKMLKMGIPADGVRHKMTKDGVDSKIVDAVFVVEEGKNISCEDPLNAALSKEQEERVVKYRKMLQMGIPANGVRHKMTKDGVDSKIVDAVFVFEEGKNISCEDPLNTALSKEEEELVVKYQKMLQMGIPADGVRHKMTKDGVSPQIIDAVFVVEKRINSSFLGANAKTLCRGREHIGMYE